MLRSAVPCEVDGDSFYIAVYLWLSPVSLGLLARFAQNTLLCLEHSSCFCVFTCFVLIVHS